MITVLVLPPLRSLDPESRTDATRTLVGPGDRPGPSDPRRVPPRRHGPGPGRRVPRRRVTPGTARDARPARHARRRAGHEPGAVGPPAPARVEGVVPALHVRPDAPAPGR